jgi:hypothetical protein
MVARAHHHSFDPVQPFYYFHGIDSARAVHLRDFLTRRFFSFGGLLTAHSAS